MNAEVQKAVYAALNAAAIANVTQIRDTPIAKPTDSNFPFIEIGAGQALPADAGGDTGLEEYIDLHVYSRNAGQKQVKEIMQAVYAALHQQSLTVSGKASAHCFLDSSRVIETPDGLTRHGILTFQIIHRT
jgi:hypothetical protein